jgi:nitrogen fixation protein NifQ
MRWKKYFYRRICDLEGFSLCSAPHCSVCKDFSSCFDDEDGISRLAQLSRELTTA